MSPRPLSCCQQCFQEKRQGDVRLWADAGQKSFGAQHQIVGKQCSSHAWRDCLLQTRQQAAAPARQLDWSPWDTYCARFVDRCCCTARFRTMALVCCVMYPFLTGRARPVADVRLQQWHADGLSADVFSYPAQTLRTRPSTSCGRRATPRTWCRRSLRPSPTTRAMASRRRSPTRRPSLGSAPTSEPSSTAHNTPAMSRYLELKTDSWQVCK